MRTLKKALCLVLVLAMVFTLAVPAMAVDKAADFKDYAKVENKEAVDVLTALDVIHGDNGNFYPEGSFTRAQAATILSYMLLGSTVADALSTGATQFSDVPATHWAAKYIQYCANEGIVNGYGNGKFGPDDTLTAHQWALMLLGALGYKASNEGIGGSGWEIQVTKLAMQAGVASAEDMTGTLNRDVAVKMAFNTLTSTKVYYEGGTNIQINGATISSGAVRKDVAQAGYKDYTEATTTDGKEATAQFCEVHFPTLKKTTVGEDYYGRPGSSWTYGKNNATIGVYSTTTPVATYTTTVSANELYNKLGSKAVIVASGSAVNTRGQYDGKIMLSNGTYSENNVVVSSKATGIGGAGVITEIYSTDTANQYIVVQIRPVLEKVSNVKAVKATATTGAYTQYTVGGKTYEVYTSNVSGDEIDTATINGTIAKNDWVMIYGYVEGNDDYAVIAPATLVTGKLTGYTSSTDSYTIDGTAYPKSAATYNAGVGVNADFSAYNQTATYAVDTYGNVVGSVTVTTANNYVFVVDAKNVNYYDSTTMVLTPGVQATIVTVDGQLQTVQVTNTVDKLVKGGLYTYTVNTKGIYTLNGTSGTASANACVIVDNISKNNAQVATGKYANGETKYYVVNQTKDSDDKVTYTGVTTYTGYTNVPTLNLTNVNARGVDADMNGIVEVVFVMPTTETVSDNFVYVTGSYTSDGTRTTYDVIVKGEATTMVLSPVSGSARLTRGLYKVENSVATAVQGETKYMTYNNGLFMTCSTEDGTYSVDTTYATIGATVPVYTFENGACDVSTAADLSASGSAHVSFATSTSNGTTSISAIYIVK